jgi:Entner-Doudoroff aldolase
MNHDQTFHKIESGRVIAILRGDFGELMEDIVTAMAAGGLTAVEVTLNSPNAVHSIHQLVRRFASTLAIGAGTVLTTQQVHQVADLGAQFIVSPNCEASVIEITRHRGLVSLPGCFTPSEIVQAIHAGADAVKLFPAQSLGVTFLKALRAPLPDVRIVPTGGVTPEIAREYKAAGAWAVGVGSELINKNFLSSDDGLEKLTKRTAEFITAMNS